MPKSIREDYNFGFEPFVPNKRRIKSNILVLYIQEAGINTCYHSIILLNFINIIDYNYKIT